MGVYAAAAEPDRSADSGQQDQQSAGGSRDAGEAECAADELPVSSIREGEVPGIHSIRYDSEADSITITHDAKNRRGFALGAVLAAEYTAKHEGALGMSDLFPFLKD